MSATAILLSMTIMSMDLERPGAAPIGRVVRETFTREQEHLCTARLKQLMTASGPGRIFSGYQPHPDGSMVLCQPASVSVSEESTPRSPPAGKPPRKGSEVYLLSTFMIYANASDKQYAIGKDLAVQEAFALDRREQCLARGRWLMDHGAGPGYYATATGAHPDGSMALCDRTKIK